MRLMRRITPSANPPYALTFAGGGPLGLDALVW